MSTLAAVCAAGAVLAFGAAPAQAGVVAQWRFDEAGGQLASDDGRFGLHGRLGSSDDADAADPARIAGASGGALRFDGTSLVRLPEHPALAVQDLTAEAVVRAPASPGAYRYVMSRGSRGCLAGSYGLYTGADGGIAVYVFDGSQYFVSASARPEHVWDGSWHHVTGTFDGRALRLYVDGAPVGDPLAAPVSIDYASTAAGARIGHYAGACDLPFSGDVDLVRLQSAALSDAAVAVAAGRPGPAASLPPAAAGTVLAGAASATACTVRLSRSRVAPGRRRVVRARVSGVATGRLVARRSGRSRPIGTARVGVTGRARLALSVRRSGRVVVRLKGRPACGHARLLVAR